MDDMKKVKVEAELQNSIHTYQISVPLGAETEEESFRPFTMVVDIDVLAGTISLHRTNNDRNYQFTRSKPLVLRAFVQCAEKALEIFERSVTKE